MKYLIFAGLILLTSISLLAGGIGKLPMANTRLFYTTYDTNKMDCRYAFNQLKKENPDLPIWKTLKENPAKDHITSFISDDILVDTSIYAQISIAEDDTATFKMQTFSSRIYTGIKHYYIKYDKALNKTNITRINNYKWATAKINARYSYETANKGYDVKFMHIFFYEDKPYCNTYKYHKPDIN